MIAISGGGIAAILMQETGLFTPLLLAAGLSFAAFAFMYMFLIKPHGKAKFVAFENENGPENIDKKLLFNVIFGVLRKSCTTRQQKALGNGSQIIPRIMDTIWMVVAP